MSTESAPKGENERALGKSAQGPSAERSHALAPQGALADRQDRLTEPGEAVPSRSADSIPDTPSNPLTETIALESTSDADGSGTAAARESGADATGEEAAFSSFPEDGEGLDRPIGKKQKKKKTKLKLQIAHQTPGRVRMKIPSAKGNPELLREIAETFGVIPGIERVSVNPTTGSVILHYDTDHHSAFNDRLASQLQSADGIHPPSTEIDELARKIQSEAEFLASHSDSAKAVVDFFKALDREIKVASNNFVDLKIVLAVGIIGLIVFEVGASAATPVWLTLTVFSLNHLIDLHQAPLERSPVVAPVVFKPA